MSDYGKATADKVMKIVERPISNGASARNRVNPVHSLFEKAGEKL